ncbi:MAG: NAD(+)/NADH kinase [Candidatus Omnitrophica bacterium]|nr:NAD(+)/NADH kinase [Candidatus Omnitrophota bacterium]
MHPPRVLVVYKRSAYEHALAELRDARLSRLLRRRHPDVLDMRRAHAVHAQALASVLAALRQAGVPFDVAYRVGLRVRRRYALVVSVGGDGTFLQAAHSVGETPILGVNSDPARSEAVFCAANRRTFPRLLQRALRGRLPQLRLRRLEARLNGRVLPQRVVNDILIAHDDPATMSRYRLRIGGRAELQKSSGLWIATAAGSSSAVLAAGGLRLPWRAPRFQYRPRELYRGRLSRNRLLGGALAPAQTVRLTWLMRRGSAFIDGSHLRVPLRYADELRIRLAGSHPVRVLGLTRRA